MLRLYKECANRLEYKNVTLTYTLTPMGRTLSCNLNICNTPGNEPELDNELIN